MTTEAGKLFDVGDQIKLRVVITDENDVQVDPTGLRIRVKLPDGTISVDAAGTPDGNGIVKANVGDFHYLFTVTITGRHVYKWDATGTAVGAEEKTFMVKETEFD